MMICWGACTRRTCPMVRSICAMPCRAKREVSIGMITRSDNASAFSVEVWIQPGALTASGIDQHVVASRDVEGPVNTGYEINVNRKAGTSQIQGRICTGGEGGGPQATEAYLELADAELGPGKDWKHVVMTFDGNNQVELPAEKGSYSTPDWGP